MLFWELVIKATHDALSTCNETQLWLSAFPTWSRVISTTAYAVTWGTWAIITPILQMKRWRLLRTALCNLCKLTCPGVVLLRLPSRWTLLQNLLLNTVLLATPSKRLFIRSSKSMLLDKEYKGLFMESNLLPLFRSSNILRVQIKFLTISCLF